MKVLFLDAPYQGIVELCPQTIQFLKKNKVKIVALYASVQFCNNLDTVKDQLKKLGITIFTSRPDRTHVTSQLLGCDNYHDSLHLSKSQVASIDYYLYVGDGKFHPLALVYAQKDLPALKEIICNDPIAKTITVLNHQHLKTILRKYRGSLLKLLSAKNVGIIITIKPGQEQFRPSTIMEKKFPDKKFYYFIDNVISFDQLENFPFIDVWVNTACPRVGFDDQEKFRRGVINLNDAFRAKEILATESVLNQV